MSIRELEDFRKKWVRELQGKNVNTKSQSPDPKETESASGQHSSLTLFEKQTSASSENVQDVSQNAPVQRAAVVDVPQDQEAEVPDNYMIQHLNDDPSNASAAYYPFRILSQLLNQSSTEVVPRYKKKTSGCEKTPTVSKKRTYFSEVDESVKKMKVDESQQGKNIQNEHQVTNLAKGRQGYLDLFIADLDEINEIPFFDVSVPREVAVKIFWHLDFQDLCRCAQVSKSWRSLAEDELLWCRICHMMGFEQDKMTVEHQNWKSRVQHFYILRKTLDFNWKNRIGKPYNLQYAQGGVLCAATSHKSAIVAGYSNCQTKVWDVLSGETCVFQPSSTALVINEAEDAGTIANEILHVATCDSLTAASYSQGFVDVWSNAEGTEPAYSFTCQGHGADAQASGLGLCENQPGSVYLAVNCHAAVQVHTVKEGQGRLVETLQFHTRVRDLTWLQPPAAQSAAWFTPILTVASYDAVNVCAVPSQEQDSVDNLEIHNVIDAPVTCIDTCAETCQVVVGYSVHTGPSQFFRANIYDIASRKLTSTLVGHTSVVSCVRMADSPPHQLVTGSRDRKVRVFDTRVTQSPAMTLIGHSATVSSVQMDEWKVASGDESGFVCVWDQRMASKLWDMHNRHPVRFCHFEDRLLVVAHVPYVKQQYGQYDYDTGFHQRHRGSLHVYDFLVDQATQGVPEICLSSYDEPQGYNYNITLAMPYDTV